MKFLCLIFLKIKLSPASAKISIFIILAPTFVGSFTIEPINGIIRLLNIISDGELNIYLPDCILDSCVF